MFPNYPAVLALAFALFAAINLGRADDATNPATSPVQHSLGLKLDFGHENTGTNDFHGLPKEAFARLSPEQLLELAKSDQAPPSAAIVVPIAMFSMIAISVALGVRQKMKRNLLMHETLRLMIEKGQPIPPELLRSPDGGSRPRNDLLYGLIFSGVGLALMVFFLTIAHGFKGPWAIGLIPLFIGIAFLIARKLEGNGPSK